jgi:hypothetical protein
VAFVITCVLLLLNWKKKTENPYRFYIKDEFFGVVWKWNYIKNSAGKFEVDIESILPECAECQTPLAYTAGPVTNMNCQTCMQTKYSFAGNYISIKFDVERAIMGKINRGEWKEVVMGQWGINSLVG